MIELTPILDRDRDEPLYIQLANYIKQEVINGKIKTNEKLPSKRKLSCHLGVSLNTIQAAYDQLGAEGYLESRPRKGLFVLDMENDLFPKKGDLVQSIPEKEEIVQNVTIDFNSGKVDLENFPYSAWRKLTIQSLFEDQGELFYNGHPQGESLLREEIANYLFTSRGVNCSSEQIIIGAGTQYMIGLLCMVIGKECSYAMENPGFHRTKKVLQDQGVKVQSISLDENGLDVSKLKKSESKVVYVTPSHQFPYGMVMPISRRMDLLKWAEKVNGYIIEDDYDGEYRYKGKPIPSLQGLDSTGRVIYLGTFSKSLIPSIRISFVVLPHKLLEKFKMQFGLYKQTASRLHQDTLFRFMKGGHWHRHLNKMRTLYKRKQDILMNAIHEYLGEKVSIIGDKSGLHIILMVKNGMSENQLILTALKIGIKVYPLSIYYDEVNRIHEPSVLLGYGGLSEDEIVEGIKGLKTAWSI